MTALPLTECIRHPRGFGCSFCSELKNQSKYFFIKTQNVLFICKNSNRTPIVYTVIQSQFSSMRLQPILEETADLNPSSILKFFKRAICVKTD